MRMETLRTRSGRPRFGLGRSRFGPLVGPEDPVARPAARRRAHQAGRLHVLFPHRHVDRDQPAAHPAVQLAAEMRGLVRHRLGLKQG